MGKRFYVMRWQGERYGYVGPLPASRAPREAAAWQECGWQAVVLNATPELRKIVNAWQKGGPTMSADGLIERAAALGREHGTAGGSWVFDGNTRAEEYVKCLELDEEGAPEWFDIYGAASGPLSGEWADYLTPDLLLVELGVDLEDEDPAIDAVWPEVCNAYEDAYYEAWRDEVLRMARYQVGES